MPMSCSVPKVGPDRSIAGVKIEDVEHSIPNSLFELNCENIEVEEGRLRKQPHHRSSGVIL